MLQVGVGVPSTIAQSLPQCKDGVRSPRTVLSSTARCAQGCQGFYKAPTDLGVRKREHLGAGLDDHIESGGQLRVEAKCLSEDSLEAVARVGLSELLGDTEAEPARLPRVHVQNAKELVPVEPAVLVYIREIAAPPDASGAREFKRHSLARGAEAHAPLQLLESFRPDPANL